MYSLINIATNHISIDSICGDSDTNKNHIDFHIVVVAGILKCHTYHYFEVLGFFFSPHISLF